MTGQQGHLFGQLDIYDCVAEAEPEPEPARYPVSYLHMRGYRVSRSFDTLDQAEEFISVNAMVCPLPGLRRLYKTSTARGSVCVSGSCLAHGRGIYWNIQDAAWVHTDGWPCPELAGQPEPTA